MTMAVRVLSEEEIDLNEQFYRNEFEDADANDFRTDIREDVLDLIATIQDRYKAYEHLKHGFTVLKDHNKSLIAENSIMLSALERISGYKYFSANTGREWPSPEARIACDTIAQVKAITVSKQEVSTVSEVACEQQVKESLSVARRNNPTHPTQQPNRLAQEVESDLQWRGERT